MSGAGATTSSPKGGGGAKRRRGLQLRGFSGNPLAAFGGAPPAGEL
jgi:hypothetical protein